MRSSRARRVDGREASNFVASDQAVLLWPCCPERNGTLEQHELKHRLTCLARLSGANREATPMKSGTLPAEARARHVDIAAREADTASTLPRGGGAYILHELQGALLPTAFFFVGFNFII